MSVNEVKQLREQLGLTQKALAVRLQVSRITVIRWENQAAKPPAHVVELLERIVLDAKWTRRLQK